MPRQRAVREIYWGSTCERKGQGNKGWQGMSHLSAGRTPVKRGGREGASRGKQGAARKVECKEGWHRLSDAAYGSNKVRPEDWPLDLTTWWSLMEGKSLNREHSIGRRRSGDTQFEEFFCEGMQRNGILGDEAFSFDRGNVNTVFLCW